MTVLHRRAFVTAALAMAAGAAKAQAQKPIPVVFHTDIGGDVDDTWALLQLLRQPELDVKLVVTEGDNAVYRGRLTAKLLALAGRDDIPLAIGSDGKDDPGHQSGWVGEYRLAGRLGPVRSDGAQAMIDVIKASVDPVTVICVGPATTLAEALRQAPDIAPKARFVGMHGAVRVGYGGAAKIEPEYNVKVDPAALQTVFAADWLSCSITPLDTCGLLYLEGADMKAIHDSADPFARACIDNSVVWLPNALWMPKDFDLTHKSSTLFDNVAVVMAHDESHLVMETLKLSVTPEGMTVIDDVAGRPVRVATAWKDLHGFKAKLVADLTRHPV